MIADRIHSIALYKARFGIIESFDVRQIDREDLIDSLVKLKNYLCTVEMRIKRPESTKSMDVQPAVAAEITATIEETEHCYMKYGMLAEANDVKIKSLVGSIYSA